MEELIKIREISSKYDISARTLRYYEDMGLLNSMRSSDYAYRLYDQKAVKRLEQILILRRLHISIKDIQRIFQAPGSEAVLEILGKKVADIDSETALLQELKEIVTEFIGLIRQSDFRRDADVRMLYEKAAKIESSIENISYRGNSSRINRLLDVTDKMKRNPEISIIQINPFRAFTSGLDSIDHVMGAFQQWQEEHNHLVRDMMYGAPDFLWFEEDGRAEWIWAVRNGVTEEDTAPYKLITFEGDCTPPPCRWTEMMTLEAESTRAYRRGLRGADLSRTSAPGTEPWAIWSIPREKSDRPWDMTRWRFLCPSRYGKGDRKTSLIPPDT